MTNSYTAKIYKITVIPSGQTICKSKDYKKGVCIRIEDESEHCDTHSFTRYTGYDSDDNPIRAFQDCPIVIEYVRPKNDD